MTHHFICNHCKHENEVSINESDRGAFQMQHGDFKDATCVSCMRKDKIHINDIYGKISKKMILTGIIIGVVITLILLFITPNVFIISGAVLSIPTIFYVYETNLVKTFNQYRIRKK